MHNSFYFLRQISRVLKEKLSGHTLNCCFSQSKNELILEFAHQNTFFYIRINTTHELCCLSFPEEFKRSKRNSIDLFGEILDKQVTDVIQFDNDRSIAISFQNYHLAILLHGIRANVILFKEQTPVVFFNKKLSLGFHYNLQDLNRPLTFTYEAFEQLDFNIKKLIPTFDFTIFTYLENRNFQNLKPEAQWNEVTQLLLYLENPSFYITFLNKRFYLSLPKIGEVKVEMADPIQAANQYFQSFTSSFFFHQERDKLFREFDGNIAKTKSFLQKTTAKLTQLQNTNEYEEFANLIMANLHQIRMEKGLLSIKLQSFYGDNEVVIPLKDTLTPQKNAELYYKKSKNKKLEVENLTQTINNKVDYLQTLQAQFEIIKNSNTLKELRVFDKDSPIASDEEIKPFRNTSFDGFEILIGKNAKSNDILLQKFSAKDDLWLHAKDVTGSHVILKYKAGKPFPAYVIERAAEIAAFNSKRKTDSHCPVIYTPRKYVRKQKGRPPGSVIVEREKIIMVTPNGF